MKHLLIILCLICPSLKAQTLLGIKYNGGIPTYRLFGRPLEFGSGLALERHTENLFGEESEINDLRLGAQLDFWASNGIQQSKVFTGISHPEQKISMNRASGGGSLSIRYMYTQKAIMPYGEFLVGLKLFSSNILISPGDDTTTISDYRSEILYFNYSIGGGCMVKLAEDIFLDASLNYNFGKKGELYDITSVGLDQNKLTVNKVQASTAGLQIEIGFVFNVRGRIFNTNNNTLGGEILNSVLFR